MPKKTFTIRKYKPGDEKKLINVFNEVFIENSGSHHQIMDKKIWDWKFANSPFGFKILVAINNKKEIVGQLAIQKNRFKYRNRYSNFYSIVDLCLKKEYRNHNFVQRCYERFLSKMNNVIIGFPSAVWAHSYPTIDPKIKVYHVPIFGKKFDKKSQKQYQDISGEISVERIRRISQAKNDLDKLWQKKKAEITIGCVRNARYLNWRFLKNPAPLNLYLIKQGNNPIGYFVLEPKKTITLVKDILILNDQLKEGLKALTKINKDLPKSEIRLMTTDPTLQKGLLKAGYAEYRREKINQNGYFVSRNPKKAELNEYYLTWADCDWDLYH